SDLCDGSSEHHGEQRVFEVLKQAVGNAVYPAPVAGVGEPFPRLNVDVHDPTPTRVHGIRSLLDNTITASNIRAKATVPMTPITISVPNARWKPLVKSDPRLL